MRLECLHCIGEKAGLMMRQVLLLIVALLTPDLAAASRPDLHRSAQVDAAVREQMREQRIPGVAVAVVLNGKIIKAKGYGLANVELATPVPPETIFEAGSITKQFVATAIMVLVEEGKLGLDDSVTKYFPEAPAMSAVTIRHLLTGHSHHHDLAVGIVQALNVRFGSKADTSAQPKHEPSSACLSSRF